MYCLGRSSKSFVERGGSGDWLHNPPFGAGRGGGTLLLPSRVARVPPRPLNGITLCGTREANCDEHRHWTSRATGRGRGVFAIVKVVAMPTASGLTINFGPTATSAQGAAVYTPAVTVGIRYAWEKLSHYKRGDGAAVEVLEIMPLMVDTTEITMVYAAALAMWDAMQLEPEYPIVLDPQTRSISFPI